MVQIKSVIIALVLGLGYPAPAVPPSGLSSACGAAYEAMMVCRQKMAAADVPASMRQTFDQQYTKQVADAVAMWRSMRGVEGVEKSCREIAQNPGCAE